MDEGFAVTGYVVEELIGRGGAGEVWRGRDVATGDPVALKLLRGRGAAVTERLRREAAVLASAAGPHVIGVRDFVVEDGAAVLVMDLAPGGSLAGLLAARDRLPAPEVVTILAPLATALAAAHARGLVHGDLTPANILFTADGRPLLADFGVARAIGASDGPVEPVEGTVDFMDPAVLGGAVPTAASDVFALGAIGFLALSGEPYWGTGTVDQVQGRALVGIRPALDEVLPGLPPALVAAIEAALSHDPYDRPDARSLAEAVLRACAAAPIVLALPAIPIRIPITELVRPAVGIDQDFVRHLESQPPRVPSPWRRHATVAAGMVVAMVGSAVLGVQLGHYGGNQAPSLRAAQTQLSRAAAATDRIGPLPVDVDPDPDWRALVVRLDAARASAFEQADPSRLADVYVVGSAPYATDHATIASLATRGVHASGFQATVEHVRLESERVTTARLRVVDRLSAYDLLDSAGHVVGHGAARPDRAFTMRLTWAAGKWRVSRITPA